MARPSIYSSELAETICARLEAGEPLAAICRDEGMPSVRTTLRWADEREDFQTLYSCALAARAEHFLEEHDRIAKTAVDRDSSAAARVQLAAIEWKMAKMAPKRYGERVDVEVGVKVDLTSLLERRRQRVIEANEQLGISGPDGDE